MIASGKFHLWTAFCLLVAFAAKADDSQMHSGFVLGSTFEAAQQHARGEGWKLTPLSDDQPGFWSVTETGQTLFVCDNTVTAINAQLEGDFEAFTALVVSMTTQLGEPQTQILNIPSGIGVISTIDARFATGEGGTVVQLQSIGEKRTLSINSWIDSACNKG
jgi:hypothetical protein